MARVPRLDLPDIPQHIVQRGNIRLPHFLDDTDRRRDDIDLNPVRARVTRSAFGGRPPSHPHTPAAAPRPGGGTTSASWSTPAPAASPEPGPRIGRAIGQPISM